MATETKASKVFAGLRCPHCGEVESLDVRVEILRLECRDCGEEVTRAEVDALFATWQRLFRWLDRASEE